MNPIDLAIRILQFSAPTAFAAIGETVGQKTGVINIGLEGIMLTSAYVAVVMSGASGSGLIGLGAAVAIGLVLSLIQAVFTIKLQADQVVAGTALNLFGLGLTNTLFDLGVANGVAFGGVPGLRIPGSPVDWFAFSVIVFGAGMGWLLFGTEYGLVLRSAGEYPSATESAGFSVARLRLAGQAIVGAMAGLGGAYLSLGISQSFAQNMTAGRGFIAIALVTFGRWRPTWVLAASLLIGFLEWLQFSVQGNSAVPIQLFLAMPYLVALGVLIVVGQGSQQPQSLGLPFRRSS